MYKFMLIAALFVAGAYGECNTDVAIGCLVGKINEVATNLNRSDLCSDLASVAHCMTAAGCAGDAGFLTSMCDHKDTFMLYPFQTIKHIHVNPFQTIKHIHVISFPDHKSTTFMLILSRP
ncbi:Hypothetical predicted protein [Octopus vulgaris]|uniref:Uncharacterized protein n=1 Tax=Octopus vulgaris TaxID=6645 RepID=A0AA36FNH3_OCTVU|nr:Hypothetical predicted protein [Octopus vulgaris]